MSPNRRTAPWVLLALLSALVGFVIGRMLESSRADSAAATNPATRDPVGEEAPRRSSRARPAAPANRRDTNVAVPTASAAVDELKHRDLKLPVRGVDRDELTPNFYESRGGRRHEALDIVAPRGTAVLAVEDGTIAKLFTSRQGGLTVYQFDATERYAYYYAHLDRYANGLHEGATVKRGDVIGYVGSTGNASPDAPHLHFGIFILGPEKRWWQGTAIDPYPVLR